MNQEYFSMFSKFVSRAQSGDGGPVPNTMLRGSPFTLPLAEHPPDAVDIDIDIDTDTRVDMDIAWTRKTSLDSIIDLPVDHTWHYPCPCRTTPRLQPLRSTQTKKRLPHPLKPTLFLPPFTHSLDNHTQLPNKQFQKKKK